MEVFEIGAYPICDFRSRGMLRFEHFPSDSVLAFYNFFRPGGVRMVMDIRAAQDSPFSGPHHDSKAQRTRPFEDEPLFFRH
jgi:hypothetical protein